jgi:hypothetical protein
MNAKKLLLGLLTATLVIIPFATLQPASATDNVTNSTVTPIHGQTGMLLMAKGKGKSQKKEHTSNARPSTAEKHQKGEKAKKDAQKNKSFQAAKKKGKYAKLSKTTIMQMMKKK